MITETIITAATTQMIKSLVEKIIAPKFEKFMKSFKTDYKEIVDRNKDYFGEYYHRTYEKYSIVNTLVFHNSQRLLKDIYVAQTLVKENRFEEEEETTRIDGMPKDLIKKYGKILITDTAGMGKSTITKRMFIDLIDNGFDGAGVPIYIELNRLNKDRSILQEIQEGLSSLSEEFDNDLLLRFIQTGGFIFFLDGYDEISTADRSEVTKDIQSFISKARTDNYFILTSRPEDSLASFGDFQSFNIQPLTRDEAFELLRKYDLSKRKELSGKLIDLLDSGQYDAIDEYLKNPLLVSLLYAAFDHKNIIPLKKHLFYGQVYEAYFDSHDLSKGIDAHQKRSGLDIDDFNRVLRYVGFECLIKLGVQFDKDTIINSISRAREFCGGDLKFPSNSLLSDLLTSVPLFSKDGPEYKWAHKSLMEYFAARFIAEDAKKNQDKILSAIYNSENFEKYLNMLDLYYDIDFKGFSKNITLPLCDSYIKYYDDNYKAVKESKVVKKYLIDVRLSCLFTTKIAFLVSPFQIKSIKSRESMRRFFKEVDPEFDYIDTILGAENNENSRIYKALGRPSRYYTFAKLINRKKSSVFAKSSLINKVPDRIWNNVLSKEINQLECNKVYVIDLKTGDQSEELYYGLNMMAIRFFSVLFDYEACKKEAERIRKEIVQSEEASDLLDGI